MTDYKSTRQQTKPQLLEGSPAPKPGTGQSKGDQIRSQAFASSPGMSRSTTNKPLHFLEAMGLIGQPSPCGGCRGQQTNGDRGLHGPDNFPVQARLERCTEHQACQLECCSYHSVLCWRKQGAAADLRELSSAIHQQPGREPEAAVALSRAPADKDPDAGEKRPVGSASFFALMQSLRLINSEETTSPQRSSRRPS